MVRRIKAYAAAAALGAGLMAGLPSAAMAEYGCVPGYTSYGGVCRPIGAPNYSNPVSGAAYGEAAGAATGYAAGGPIGAVVGGAFGLAAGTLTGTANMVTGAPPPAPCGYGYHWSRGYCYPNR